MERNYLNVEVLSADTVSDAPSFNLPMDEPITGLPYKLTRTEVLEQIRGMGYDGEVPRETIEEFIEELRDIYRAELDHSAIQPPLQMSSMSESSSTFRLSQSPHREIKGDEELERELEKLGIHMSAIPPSWSNLDNSTILRNLDALQPSILDESIRNMSYTVPDRHSRRSPSPPAIREAYKPLADFTQELSIIEDKLKSVNLSSTIERQRREANSPTRSSVFSHSKTSPPRSSSRSLKRVISDYPSIDPSIDPENESASYVDHEADPEQTDALPESRKFQLSAWKSDEPLAEDTFQEEANQTEPEAEDAYFYSDQEGSDSLPLDQENYSPWQEKSSKLAPDEIQRQLHRRFRLQLRQNDPVNLYHKYNASWSRNKFLSRVSSRKAPSWAGDSNKEYTASKLGIPTSENITPAPAAFRAKLPLAKSLC